jgi:hypothetical protein
MIESKRERGLRPEIDGSANRLIGPEDLVIGWNALLNARLALC